MIRYIPNTLTCISLIFGFYAGILGLTGNYFGATSAILTAALFDFFDGLTARQLKAYSAVGKELDSLADIVSFGVAPGMILFRFMDDLLFSLSRNESMVSKSVLLTAFAIPVFSAIRLAKFNVDERQQTSFVGLPVPAHAILWSSLVTVLAADVRADYCFVSQLSEKLATIHPEIMLICLSAMALGTSCLLIVRIQLFSLKTTTLSWKANKNIYILCAIAFLLLLLFGMLGVTLSILFYIMLSFIFKSSV